MKQISNLAGAQYLLHHGRHLCTSRLFAQEASANAMNGMFNRPEKEEQLA